MTCFKFVFEFFFYFFQLKHRWRNFKSNPINLMSIHINLLTSVISVERCCLDLWNKAWNVMVSQTSFFFLILTLIRMVDMEFSINSDRNIYIYIYIYIYNHRGSWQLTFLLFFFAIFSLLVITRGKSFMWHLVSSKLGNARFYESANTGESMCRSPLKNITY